MALDNQLFVSVIIPVHNGGEHINKCLDALLASSYPSFEIIMVDDCSNDGRAAIARQKGIILLQLSKQSGPAVARNFGAQHARGDIILFVDSDVLVYPETIELLVADFLHNHNVVAVFGSFDDDPHERNFVSQYKNLFHHFHHQYANTEAFSFWINKYIRIYK
jgi:glycosyltransferase involved in cell wall biosynthesis